MNNKDHWYDGAFYDLAIAPWQDGTFVHVGNLIAEGSTVLDVGCGTGRLTFQLAGRCRRIDGIDPSLRNIEIARRTLAGRPDNKVRFHHADAESFLAEQCLRFDYATLTYVLHEIPDRERRALLMTVSSAARYLIFADYLVPQPGGIRKVIDAAIEFAAGPDHYRNFRSYIAGGGLTRMVEAAGLSVVSEIRDDPPSGHVVLATRKVSR